MTSKKYRKECKSYAISNRHDKKYWQLLRKYQSSIGRKLRFLMKIKAHKLIKK